MKEIRFGKAKFLPETWSYGVSFTRDYNRLEGWIFNVWCFKLKSTPQRGELFDRKHYKGINWRLGVIFKFRLY